MDSASRLKDARVAAAFASNRLLATFDEQLRGTLAARSTIVDLGMGDEVLRAGNPVERTLFPFNSLMVSMIVDLSGGRSVEVASIGKEGAIGGVVSCGHAPAYARAEVQIAGPAIAIPLDALEEVKEGSPFLYHLFCRYADYLLAQVMQSVACNAFHSIEARAARWLLTAQDRIGGHQLALTQESLAGLLGVQRTTINAVARQFQDQGLISYRRGSIQVLDRAGLERQSCECYAAVENHFTAVIGLSGHGTKSP
ncbi:MAG: Crp/Fnr family transcriptional regulator [Sphingomicrobium sp.]